MSPMKSKEQLANVGKMVKRVYDIDFIIKDLIVVVNIFVSQGILM